MFPWEILDTIMDSNWAGIRLGLTCSRLLARMGSIDLNRFIVKQPCDNKSDEFPHATITTLPNGVMHAWSAVADSMCKYDRGLVIMARSYRAWVWRIPGAQVDLHKNETGKSIVVRHIRFTPLRIYYNGRSTGKIPPPEILALFDNRLKTPEVVADWLNREGIVFQSDPDSPLILPWAAPQGDWTDLLPGCIFKYANDFCAKIEF